MLTPPDGLRLDLLEAAVQDGWGLRSVELDYRALGFGSHHWEVRAAGGDRWFATLDELQARRTERDEPLDSVYGRLRASVKAAADLRLAGLEFAASPVPTVTGEPMIRLSEAFSLALYPFIDGRSYVWGEYFSPEHRRAILDHVVAIHTAPALTRRHALRDDLAIGHRAELDLVLDGWRPPAGAPACGPYEQPTLELVARFEPGIRDLLAVYDELAAKVVARPERAVLTHGEPHVANSMLTETGWVLIDWDTALISPPERDLCNLDPGDGSILAAYEGATGTVLLPEALELFRRRWDLADLAIAVSQFTEPHSGNANDAESFELLGGLLERATGLSST
ncbi:MAG TPA: phosphotransferase [Streptosporangiaceae bacterium]|nr:phosphotransferase [Streptosporangiaceae bacterium]